MPRCARKQCERNIYHVMLRKINRQNIFLGCGGLRKNAAPAERITAGLRLFPVCILPDEQPYASAAKAGRETDEVEDVMASIANVFSIATPESKDLFEYFKELLSNTGLSLANEMPFETVASLPKDDFFAQCFHHIDVLFVFYSTQNHNDEEFRTRLEKIIRYVQNRDIQVFILSEEDYTKPIYRIVDHKWKRVNSDQDIEKEKQLVGKSIWLISEDGWIRRGVRLGVAKMYELLRTESEKKGLYNKLNMLNALGYTNAISQTLSSLIKTVCAELTVEKEPQVRRKLFKEIWRLVVELKACNSFTGSYDENREAAQEQLSAICAGVQLLQEKEFHPADLFFSAYAISFIYVFALIQHDMVEYCTNDDVHLLLDKERRAAHVNAQQPYLDIYMSIMSQEDSLDIVGGYPQDERQIILDAQNMQVANLTDDGHSVLMLKDGVLYPAYSPAKAVGKQLSEEDQLLVEISVVLRKAMSLFDQMPEEAKAEDYYQYLRTAYERLKSYSETIGNEIVAVECVDRISEIMNILDHIKPKSAEEGKSAASLRSLLGLKMRVEGKYDVFISYKHENEDIARRIYSYCEMHHISPFLDFKTLPNLSKSEYEEAIMNALENSKHFIVVLTELSQLNSHWINLEMRVFEHEMSEGRKDNANFLFVVSDQVFEEIIASNKRCIPIQYRAFEIMQITDYREKLSNYLV